MYSLQNTKLTTRFVYSFAHILIILFAYSLSNEVLAQNRLPELTLPTPRVEVMLVGVFHFAQATEHEFDILSPQRQAETEEVALALSRFEPTKVMVELQPYFWQRRLDSLYTAYRAGRYVLPRNEVFQLGFRIAHHVGLDRVWAIDHAGFWLGDTLRAVAGLMNQTDLLDGTAPYVYPGPEELIPRDSLYRSGTVRELLRWMSSPAYQARMYDLYVNRFARVGIVPGDDFDEYDNEVGGDLLAEWVRRNIKIYREILSRTSYEGGERLLIFIGSDHVAPMRQFFEANLNFKVVEVSDFL